MRPSASFPMWAKNESVFRMPAHEFDCALIGLSPASSSVWGYFEAAQSLPIL
jgi:hypothetical protein